jgi:hypothetical protein
MGKGIYVDKSMGKRMFGSFSLLFFMLLCFPLGCIRKSQRWKING